MKKFFSIIISFLFLSGCLCTKQHDGFYDAKDQRSAVLEDKQYEEKNISDIEREMKEARKEENVSAYEMSVKDMESGLKEGEIAVVLVDNNKFIMVSKEKDNKYAIVDEDVYDGKKAVYSQAEFEKVMSGKTATALDASGNNVVKSGGYATDAAGVKVVTDSSGIRKEAETGKTRELGAAEKDAAKGRFNQSIPAAASSVSAKEDYKQARIYPDDYKGEYMSEDINSAQPSETYFAFDSYGLSDISKENIAAGVQQIKDKTYYITVQGHTDSIGSREYNQKLSLRRAQSVKEELVKNGLEASRIEIVGYGEDRPITDNSSAEGRARNRRVVLFIEAVQK